MPLPYFKGRSGTSKAPAGQTKTGRMPKQHRTGTQSTSRGNGGLVGSGTPGMDAQNTVLPQDGTRRSTLSAYRSRGGRHTQT